MPQALEDQEIRWVTIDQMRDIDFVQQIVFFKMINRIDGEVDTALRVRYKNTNRIW